MIKNIILKEWKEIKAENSLFLLSLATPILLLVISIVFTLSVDPTSHLGYLKDFIHVPFLDMDKFSGPAIMVRFFIPLFLIICTMLPINFTTHSIISEKASGTMESVLLTPISTKQFLVGKILAFSIPVVLVTWVVQLIYIIFIILPLKDSGTFLSPMWLFVMFLSVPCMTIISVGIGTMISAKVNSVPVARQIGGLLIIPVMANAVSQVMISSFINHIWIQLSLLVFLIMCAVVVVLLNFSLFNREKIIEGWK